MILITGATGHLGREVINFLLQKNAGIKIAALVRSEEKGKVLKDKGVELRVGDYLDTDSLKKALKGISTVLLISSSSMGNRVQQHSNVIHAAKEEGVAQIFYTSMVQSDKLLSMLAPDHFETEKLIKASGIPFTIFRHTFYAEFIPFFMGKAAETGTWYFPSNGRKVNFALRTEMAEALANALVNRAQHTGRIYEITSSTSYTLSEISSAVSSGDGKTVQYTDVPVTSFREQLTNAGLPAEAIAMTAGIGESFSKGALDITDTSFEKLLGRRPADTKEYVSKLYNNSNN